MSELSACGRGGQSLYREEGRPGCAGRCLLQLGGGQPQEAPDLGVDGMIEPPMCLGAVLQAAVGVGSCIYEDAGELLIVLEDYLHQWC